MSDVSFEILEGADELFDAAADAFVCVASAAIAERDHCLVALAGGSTPRGLFQRLTEAPHCHRIDWSRVSFFWGDERPVGPDHADSNYAMARRYLLDPLGIDEDNVYRITGEEPDLGLVARRYAQTIATIAGWQGGPPPHLDVVLLGLGTDAHTASLFPGTRAVTEDEEWVVANRVPQLDTRRITITLPLINSARHVFFLAAGHDKKDAIARTWQAVNAGRRDLDLPASLVTPADGAVRWFVDTSAAAHCDVCIEETTNE